MSRYFKLARPDGFDFYTGKTINYRDNIGGVVRPPRANVTGELCSDALIHASDGPNKCFLGNTTIPCSAYVVEGEPVVCDENKCGFVELTVVEEVTDFDTMFGWNYSEATDPINPLLVAITIPIEEAIKLLGVWDSVWDSVGDSVGDSAGASVWASVVDSVGDSVWDSVWDSVGDSVGDSAGASVWGYIGSMFPGIDNWKYVEHKPGEYPFKSCSDLWRGGYIPSFDGKKWRLHRGEKADVVYEHIF